MELEEAVSLALDEGIDFVEVRKEKSETTMIRMIDGVVRELSRGSEFRISVRTLYKGGWGLGVASSLDELKNAVKDAVELAKLSSKWAEPIEPEWPSFKGKYEVKAQKPAWEVSTSEKIELVREQDEQARKMDKIRNTNIIFGDVMRETRVVNSLGTDVDQKIARVRLAAYIFSHEAGLTESAFESKGGIGGMEIVEGSNVAELAAKRAVEALSAKPAPPGASPAILDPKLAGVFIHEAFGHAAEGDAIVNNQSILVGKMGKKVGSDVVSVVDDPTIEGLYGSYKYDDEGTESKRKYIVKKGLLSGYMTSLETALRLKMEPTGNARSMDYSNPPIVRMSNTFIEAGDWSFDEILSEMKRGIYAFGSLYGYTDPAKGQFMFKAEGGWLIENGELKQRLREVAITGMTLDVLHNIDAVAKDLAHDPGMCGKYGQWVPVTTGAPHVRVKKLVFGGR